MENYSYDWDGEVFKQRHESARQTAFRQWQESNERRILEGYRPIDWDESKFKKQLDEED